MNQNPKKGEWVLGSPKPTNIMRVAFWAKERAEQNQGVLRGWGLEFWGLPSPRLAVNRALTFTISGSQERKPLGRQPEIMGLNSI